ncbi:MAG: winged helix-turn-helix domain-containing protein [Candidatus Lokiarchaeia archaeon]
MSRSYINNKFKNCTKVAEIIKKDRRSVQLWINAFNEGGLEAIVLNSPSGRPSSLSEDQKEDLKADVLTHPRELGYEFSNWKGKSVAYHIEKKFGVSLSVRQAQRLLHQLGLSLQRPKYKFPKADLEKQKEFLNDFKKSWILLEKAT